MEYVVVVHRAEEGGYWVEMPTLPGCFAQGETLEEALLDAKEAIESHRAALLADGKTPEEHALIATVQVAA